MPESSEAHPDLSGFPALARSRHFSLEAVRGIGTALEHSFGGECGSVLTVAAAGSLGRLEASERSDVDCIVVVDDSVGFDPRRLERGMDVGTEHGPISAVHHHKEYTSAAVPAPPHLAKVGYPQVWINLWCLRTDSGHPIGVDFAKVIEIEWGESEVDSIDEKEFDSHEDEMEPGVQVFRPPPRPRGTVALLHPLGVGAPRGTVALERPKPASHQRSVVCVKCGRTDSAVGYDCCIDCLRDARPGPEVTGEKFSGPEAPSSDEPEDRQQDMFDAADAVDDAVRALEEVELNEKS